MTRATTAREAGLELIRRINRWLVAGAVTGLEGTNVAARLRSAQGSLALVAQLQIDPRSGAVTGEIGARPRDETEGGG